MKLAIALQVCPLDVWTAMRLVKLLVSFERERNDIEFIVSARRGTNMDAVAALARTASTKFNDVRVIKGKRFGEGWPHGCNDLWQETMMRIGRMALDGDLKSTGVLTFESDCIPLRPDWLDVLAEEWRKWHEEGAQVVGHAHSFPDPRNPELADKPNHINGNAIFSTLATERFPALNGSSANQGWDAFHGDLLLSIGHDTNSIFQKYRIQKITRNEVEEIRKNDEIPGLFHGIKGTDGLEAIESMIADGSFFSRV